MTGLTRAHRNAFSPGSLQGRQPLAGTGGRLFGRRKSRTADFKNALRQNMSRLPWSSSGERGFRIIFKNELDEACVILATQLAREFQSEIDSGRRTLLLAAE